MVVADGERNETEREIFDGRARRAATTAVSGLLSPIIQTFERINHFRFFPFFSVPLCPPSLPPKRRLNDSSADLVSIIAGRWSVRFDDGSVPRGWGAVPWTEPADRNETRPSRRTVFGTIRRDV